MGRLDSAENSTQFNKKNHLSTINGSKVMTVWSFCMYLFTLKHYYNNIVLEQSWKILITIIKRLDMNCVWFRIWFYANLKKNHIENQISFIVIAISTFVVMFF